MAGAAAAAPTRPATDAAASTSDAVALFVDCATRAVPAFRLDRQTTDAVSRIVHRVDGIPLAIELAAARLRVLTIDEIAAGSSDHLRMLGGGPVRAARHHTMRASLDWSYALLEPRLAALFAGLSIFAGGWTLPAAEADLRRRRRFTADAMLDAIAGLVDRSLVIAERDGPTTRYRMLDFVRQYARERLADDPAADAVALAAPAVLPRLRRASPIGNCGPCARTAGRCSTPRRPNLRQAVVHASDEGGTDALRLVGAMALYWRERGRLDEGIRAIEDALARHARRAVRAAGAGPGRAVHAHALAWRLRPHCFGGHRGDRDGRDW